MPAPKPDLKLRLSLRVAALAARCFVAAGGWNFRESWMRAGAWRRTQSGPPADGTWKSSILVG